MSLRHLMHSLIFLGWLLPNAIGQSTNASQVASAEELFAQGVKHYEESNFQAAVISFQKFVRFGRPTNYLANMYLGFSYYYLNDFDEAAAVLTAATRSDPDNPEAHYWRGASLYQLNRFEEASDALKRTLVLDPAHPDAWFRLGCCQYSLRAFDNAAKSFQQATAQNPTDYEAQMWTGYSHFRAFHFEPAAAAFQQAIDLRPKDFDANLWRGWSLIILERFADAVANLEEARRIKPEDISVREALLLCYLVTGHFEKIPDLHLSVLLAVPILLIIMYLPVTTFLFCKSLTLHPRPAPRLRFVLAWGGVTGIGQVIAIYGMLLLSWSGPIALGYGSILSALPLVVAARMGFARQPWGIAFQWPSPFPGGRVVLTALIALFVVNALNFGYLELVERLLGKPIPDQNILSWLGANVRNWPLSAILSVVLASPVAEEIFFRGLLFAAIQKWLSPGWTVVVTSAVFALVHGQPWYVLPLFLIGVVLGMARLKSGSLALPIIIHCVNNGIALLISSRP